MRFASSVSAAALLIALFGCGSSTCSDEPLPGPDAAADGAPQKDGAPGDAGALPPGAKTFTVDFANGLSGWSAGFTDYPIGQETFYELASGERTLPAPLDTKRKAFMIEGNNHSDDLFMYLRGPLTGLAPKTRYAVLLSFELATDAASDCVGVGGSPGTSVYVKGGAVEFEPTPSRIGTDVDKGNQANGGSDMAVLGNAGNTGTCSQPRYELKTFSNTSAPLHVTTGADGTIWAMVGTDSGFEGKSTFYYTSVAITVTPE